MLKKMKQGEKKEKRNRMQTDDIQGKHGREDSEPREQPGGKKSRRASATAAWPTCDPRNVNGSRREWERADRL